jgi:hypothetical protein
MDKLFIFICIISLSAGEALLFTPASHALRAPALSPLLSSASPRRSATMAAKPSPLMVSSVFSASSAFFC